MSFAYYDKCAQQAQQPMMMELETMRPLRKLALTTTLGILFAGGVQAADFVPETLTVEAEIKPGPNIYVLDQSWKGPSQIAVYSVDDLSGKGNMSFGVIGNVTFSPDRKTAWTASAYQSRIMYGDMHAIVQKFDVPRLRPVQEVEIPEKLALVAPSVGTIQLSGDGKYLFVQNATPATSITVVDVAANKVLGEVPIPGCWGAFAALEGSKFTAICGNGAMTSFSVKADGSYTTLGTSARIFDADTEPLFVHAERAGKDLLFLSYHGRIFRVNDSGDTPKLVEHFNYTENIDGKWAPGGVQMFAYNAANNILFVTMHPDAKDGSHKNPGHEIWAVNLKTQKVLYRSPVEEVISIAVTSGKIPVLFGLNEDKGSLTRYEVDPEAKFAAKLTKTREGMGSFAVFAVIGE
ncbi:hypothetical protein AGMMS50225_00250 [Betaproteobacteria bacterium]|nr:hypothetical protein AGMMS50225_00250 [Betaproteobacteria bacterium]